MNNIKMDGVTFICSNGDTNISAILRISGHTR